MRRALGSALLVGIAACDLPPLRAAPGAPDAAAPGEGWPSAPPAASTVSRPVAPPRTRVGRPAAPFRDATEDAGVAFVVAPAAGELLAGGVGLLDADGDGDLDLFLTSDATPSAFYRNLGDATFVDATGEAGLAGVTAARGVAIGDYDDDGDPDLYVCRAGPDQLWRNDGGAFVETGAALGVANEQLAYSAVWCDVDMDGDLDLYVGNYLITLNGRDSPLFRGHPNRLYRNDGGGFVDVAPLYGLDSTGATLAVACVDFDDDGDPDLYEVNDYGMFQSPNRLWRNDRGAWVDVAREVGVDAAIFGMGATAADYDNDGDLDLYATNVASNVLHRNEGRAFVDVAREVGADAMGFRDDAQGFLGYRDYSEATEPWDVALRDFVERYADASATDHLLTSWSAVFLDYDHDGWQDLYVANGFVAIAPSLPEGRNQPNVLLRNLGGRFADRTRGSGADVRGQHRAAAAGDLDGDGDLDLVTAGGGPRADEPSDARVLLNEGPVGRWLIVRPVGTRSSRDAVGTRVTVRAGGLVQTRETASGSGFASASPPIAHFGLRDAAVADQVKVRWPSGAVTTLCDVTADQVVVVEEPE